MSTTNTYFDVVVLGTGQGGYVAAIRAAQLGKTGRGAGLSLDRCFGPRS